MASIEVTDLEGTWKDKLVGHLKSEDFFAVDKFPKANFEITSLNDKLVVGVLTIKGISHEISFPAEVAVNGSKVNANGTATIDRTKWNIQYGSGQFFSNLGDNMISDEFEIRFELVTQ
jgi:polyisoprenoid-binding protein YceI